MLVQHQTRIEKLYHELELPESVQKNVVASARLPKRLGEQTRTLIIERWGERFGDDEFAVREFYHETKARGNGRYVTSIETAMARFTDLLLSAWSNIEEV